MNTLATLTNSRLRPVAQPPAMSPMNWDNKQGRSQSMSLRTLIAALMVLAVLFLSACSGSGSNGGKDNQPTRTVVDAIGREVKVPQKVIAF